MDSSAVLRVALRALGRNKIRSGVMMAVGQEAGGTG